MNDRQIIVTTHKIVNPKVDRRSKNSWECQEVFPIGTRFCLERWIDKNNEVHTLISKAGCSYGRISYTHWDQKENALVDAILANYETTFPKDADEMKFIADCEWSNGSILDDMLRLGIIGLNDFVRVAEVVRKDDEESERNETDGNERQKHPLSHDLQPMRHS